MNDNLQKAWKIIRSVQESPVLEDSFADQMVIHTALAWEEHPHSAMETLSGLAQTFHLRNSKRMVSSIVERWKQYPDYDWRAGGGADHCFLLGLLASGNADLASPDHLASSFPEYFLSDEHMGNRVTEYKVKRELVLRAKCDEQSFEKSFAGLEDLDNSGANESKPQIAIVSLTGGEDIKDLETYETYARIAYRTLLNDDVVRGVGGYVTLADCNLERELAEGGSRNRNATIRFRNASALHLTKSMSEHSIAALIDQGTISIESLTIGRSK